MTSTLWVVGLLVVQLVIVLDCTRTVCLFWFQSGCYR